MNHDISFSSIGIQRMGDWGLSVPIAFGVRVAMQLRLWWVCLALLSPWNVQAQWTTQSIVLQPGWNAVCLEVQPEPRDCDAIFADLPIESVWAWNRRFNSVQFLQDASKLIPGQPDWLTYFPVSGGSPSMTTLFALHGGRCYLIKSTATESVTWNLQGRAVVPSRDWIKGSLNLVGFPIDSVAPPTFANFFSASVAHSGQPIFRLQPSGLWERVANPATTAMRAGEAFWIFAAEASTYGGPVSVGLEESSGIDFGRTVPEAILTLKNVGNTARTLLLTPKASQPSADPNSPALAGSVPLSYWRMELATKTYGWFPLRSAVPLNLAIGEEVRLRVAVNRAEMAPFSPASGGEDHQYQSLLEISDQAGTRLRLPVTARRGGAEGGPRGPSLQDGETAINPQAGLWVGTAVLRGVSQAGNPADSSTPRPTGSEAQFRLIVHVNAAGQARLLQQVMLMWTNGVVDDFGDLLQLGRRVLISDDALASKYTGAALRDGKAVARRISSVAFSNPKPLSMIGSFGAVSNPLTCAVIVGYEDPLNPFKHRFHPDHDNLDESFAKLQSEGLESFTVQRALSLKFTPVDPEGLATSRWGDSQVGGEYRETITGLHKVPIVVRGVFRLNRVSLIPYLDNEG